MTVEKNPLSGLDMQAKVREYRQLGYTVIDGLIPREVATRWSERILNLRAKGELTYKGTAEGEEFTEGLKQEYQNYFVLGGRETAEDQTLREMFHFYYAFLPMLGLITGVPMVASPYPDSIINCKIYWPPEGQQGGHFDTNGFTFLLYLSDNEEEGETALYPLTQRRNLGDDRPQKFFGEAHKVEPRMGRVLLMQGRECWHWASGVKDKPKVACPWNYYMEGDTWRPKDMDFHTTGVGNANAEEAAAAK